MAAPSVNPVILGLYGDIMEEKMDFFKWVI